jgi:hypothetical protein
MVAAATAADVATVQMRGARLSAHLALKEEQLKVKVRTKVCSTQDGYSVARTIRLL